MNSTVEAFALIIAASGAGVFLLAYAFAIFVTFGINTKKGLISLIVPLLAFVLCWRQGGEALFPVKMGAIGLLLCLITLLPIYFFAPR